MSIAVVILAAGKGTRMQSDLPKVLHEIASAPMLVHAMRSAAYLNPDHVIVVAGHGAEQVERAAKDYDPDVKVVLQTEQLGTGHAVAQAKSALDGFQGDVVVLYGDTPFIGEDTLLRMKEERAKSDLVILGFDAKDPGRYGRLVTSGDALEKIVEFKDASPEERAITLCNSGVMAAAAPNLFRWIESIENKNASEEYYLTDCVEIARNEGKSASVVRCDEEETLGVNSRVQLSEAEYYFQTKARTELMETGVTLHAPETVVLAFDTIIGRDVVIEPNVVFGPDVTVETGARLRAFSHLEGCHVSRGSVVGPYARLRPGAELAENTRVGNFVEIKNAQIGEGSKINHLSYIGDAEIGKASNIGAGTITCNYDGVFKHKTRIGDDVFVGSNTMLVAPVALGDRAMTGSGSVITEDVPTGDLALGRSKQVNKKGLGAKLMDLLRAKKAKQSK